MLRCKICGMAVMRSYGGQCMRCLAYERHGTAKTLWFVLAVGLVVVAVLVWLTGPSWAQLGEPETHPGAAGRVESGPSETITPEEMMMAVRCRDMMEQAMWELDPFLQDEYLRKTNEEIAANMREEAYWKARTRAVHHWNDAKTCWQKTP